MILCVRLLSSIHSFDFNTIQLLRLKRVMANFLDIYRDFEELPFDSQVRNLSQAGLYSEYRRFFRGIPRGVPFLPRAKGVKSDQERFIDLAEACYLSHFLNRLMQYSRSES